MKKASVFILALLAFASACARPPAFDARSFRASYEAAFHNKDIAYFENLFSKDFWMGNQYQNREQALQAIQKIFEDYDDIQATFEILSAKTLPGSKSLILNARLLLQGQRVADGQVITINSVTGGAVYVYERGAWRLYKTVEKSLSAPV
jgi:hypothetical protein